MSVIQGIQTPLQFDETGGLRVAEPLLKIKQNVQMILTTSLGSRIMEPNYGSTIPSLIGEFNDSITSVSVKKEVIERLASLEKNIKTLKVDVTTEGTKIFVYVKYKIITFDVEDEVLLQI